MDKIKYLAVDPGESNGLTAYDKNAKFIWMLEVPKLELPGTLQNLYGVSHVICEEFRIYPQMAMSLIYNNMVASRAIGNVEYWADLIGAHIVMQKAALKKTGFQYLGMKEPPHSVKNHNALVSHAHGTYWLVQQGLIDPASLIKK